MKSNTKASQPPAGEYMNKSQMKWFKAHIQSMLDKCDQSIMDYRTEKPSGDNTGDECDKTTERIESERRNNALAALWKKRREIEQALVRIDEGDFGFCEDTGDEIGLDRLMAAPLAKCTIEAQTRRELRAKMMAA